VSEATVDTSELAAWTQNLRLARFALHEILKEALGETGDKLLALVVENIETRKLVATRNLLHSFQRGSPENENIWVLKEGTLRLTLEVGSKAKYARAVNDGHRQTPGRFIPGYWIGTGREAFFLYDPDADEGMVLKQNWVLGNPYFTDAANAMEKYFPEICDKWISLWVAKYFYGFG
jgi:hypothetical protein